MPPIDHLAALSSGGGIGSSDTTPTHAPAAIPTAFPGDSQAGLVNNEYKGPTLDLPSVEDGGLDVKYGSTGARNPPAGDPYSTNPVGIQQDQEACFSVGADGTSHSVACNDYSCDQDWKGPIEDATCESDSLHPCNGKFLKEGTEGAAAVGEYGAAVVSIVQDPELEKKVRGEGDEMPNAVMQQSPDRLAMQGMIVEESERRKSEGRTPPRSSVSASRLTPARRGVSAEDDRESCDMMDSPPPLVPVLTSSSTSTSPPPAQPQNDNIEKQSQNESQQRAVVPVPIGPPPAPIRRPLAKARPVQAGLGLGPPSSSSTAPAVCPPVSASSSSSGPSTGNILSMGMPPAPKVKAPPAVPGPSHAGCIQTTVRNPQAVVEEQRQFVRCTGPCCDPAAAASLAQQQMQLQMHLMQQQQMAAQQQQAAAKNAPKAAPIMLTPYQHKWLISGQREGEDGKKKYNWLKEFGCTEGHSILPKPINPKRMCSKMLNPSGDSKDGACSMQ